MERNTESNKLKNKATRPKPTITITKRKQEKKTNRLVMKL